MRLRLLILLIICLLNNNVFATHIKGGLIEYRYLGPAGPGISSYEITIKVYVRCSSNLTTPNNISAPITNLSTRAVIPTSITKSGDYTLSKTTFNTCISPIPTDVCYRISSYSTTINLPDNDAGYEINYTNCCRINGIANIIGGVGSSYSNRIPGTREDPDFVKNSSPEFFTNDTAVVCFNSNFTYDFSAQDAEGDSLSYSFCNALSAVNTSVTYINGYSGGSPMGANVSIDPKTGLISGIAPNETGDYVVAVCASEYRKGKLIGTSRKELHIAVANCSVQSALLKPEYINCKTYEFSFLNESVASNVESYLWDFGVPNTNTDTSHQAAPNFTYPDTGTYRIKLKISTAAGCNDSAFSTVKVYPVFTGKINISGSCILNPYQFTDISSGTSIPANKWHWDFGEANITTDTSSQKNPLYKFTNSGIKKIQLFLSNTKGCLDTVTQQFEVVDKPLLNLNSRDTLICSIDTLQLFANINSGNISWMPNYNINNTSITNPYVFPKDTITYYATLSDNGCINTDSIRVNVVDYISIQIKQDTTICKTDSFTLRPNSYATSYLWEPAIGLNNPTLKNPLASPDITRKYYVTGNLGYCQAKDSVTITVAAKPSVNIGPDTTICFGNRLLIVPPIADGSLFEWQPANIFVNNTLANAIVAPSRTSNIILQARNTNGCLFVARDTMTIRVIPPINVNAGKDTGIVIGEPIKLHPKYTSGKYFKWSPDIGLDSSDIVAPTVLFQSLPAFDSIRYKLVVSTDGGCEASDDIVLRIFKSTPEIFVPTAFTPNNDGLNDCIKPILVGMRSLNYFRVFNRWGQLIFETREKGKCWDGTINGSKQQAGTFVFSVQAIDYKGEIVNREGSFVLMR